MHSTQLVLSPRVRKTAFEDRVFEQGIEAYTVYNHMTLPVSFGSNPDAYEHLCQHVQLWDVAAERQVEVVGPDALQLIELITPRDIASVSIGQCVYAPLVDEGGMVINDPLILRLADDRFWISIADSDVLLWVKGLAYGSKFDVKVFEPDVSPLAVQGPKADDVLSDLLDDSIRKLGFFRFIETKIAGTEVVLARSGWSGQGGFEIYLQDSSQGLALWDAVWSAGEKYQIRAGAPHLIERLETGLKSYGSDMTIQDHVLECGFERYLHIDKPAAYMAREAILRLQKIGVSRRLCHVMAQGAPLPALRDRWQVEQSGASVGTATSCAWSPKYKANLLFAMLSIDASKPGAKVNILVDGVEVRAIVCDDRWQQG